MKRGDRKKNLLEKGILSFGKSLLSNLGGLFVDRVEEKIDHIQNKVTQKIMASLLVTLGFFALFLSLYYYLSEILLLQKFLIFLVTGAVLLIVGFYMKYKILRNEKEVHR